MDLSRRYTKLLLAISLFGGCYAAGAAASAQGASTAAQSSTASCPGDDTGLTLPAGFCATIFAEGIGHARQSGRRTERGRLRQYLVRSLLRQRHTPCGRLPRGAARHHGRWESQPERAFR